MAQLLSHAQISATLLTIVHQAPLSMGIFQARILEWNAISFSRGSSQSRDQTHISGLAGRFFTQGARGATWEYPVIFNRVYLCLLLGRQATINLDSALKSRDINFPTKVCIVKAMVFLTVICLYESWTMKKAEHQRTDAFKLWCWRRLLRVPWKTRRSNQSILKEINSKYSLERLMLKLKL